MARVITYGSSTTYGLWGREGGEEGYAELLKNSLMESTKKEPEDRFVHVYNRGRPAENIAQTVLQVAHDTNIVFGGQRGRTIAAFMLGTYDHVILPNETEPITPRVRFLADLGRIDELCTQSGIIALFIGLPPLDDRYTQPTGTGEVFNDDSRREYEDMVRQHADRHGYPFVEVYDALGGKDVREHGFIAKDYLHINGPAHRIIHNLLLSKIKLVLNEPNPFHPITL
jgi:hypothetical protein